MIEACGRQPIEKVDRLAAKKTNVWHPAGDDRGDRFSHTVEIRLDPDEAGVRRGRCLGNEMLTAAEQMEFEKAAELRDKIMELKCSLGMS